jgi:ubiquinone/menaquinone biosynthesis C-methylase UbiE
MFAMPDEDLYDGFSHVDTTEETGIYTGYLEFIDSLECFRQIKEESYRMLDLHDGSSVLEAGCGVGFDALRLAGRVGMGGSVTGIDLSETMIRQAELYATGTGLPVKFQTGDLHRLEFPAGLSKR